MSFYTYLLRCADGSYYVGHTENLDIRIAQHDAGTLGGYTATRRPVRLLWCSDMPSRQEAWEAEKKIKGWTRAKKEALIAGDWALLRDLAKRPAVREKPSGEPATHGGTRERRPPSRLPPRKEPAS